MYKFELKDNRFLPHLACNVSLELEKGEGMVIAGPNGIGKTTLVQWLVREYQGKYLLSLIGQRPLDYFYDRTVRDVRDILFRNRKEMIEDKKFPLLWNELGLAEKEERPLSALSGGELQSLKLALGLGKRASLFVMDEPFQSLDEARKSVLLKVLDNYRAEGLSVIVVEHDLQCFSAGWRVVPLQVTEGTLISGEAWTT